MSENIEYYFKRLEKMREENLITEEEYKNKMKEYLTIEAEKINGVSKSRILYVLLAIFLGVFGIHSFYIGDRVKGGVKIFLFLLSILISSVSDEYSNFPLFLTACGSFIFPALVFWGIIDAIFTKKDAKGMPLKW